MSVVSTPDKMAQMHFSPRFNLLKEREGVETGQGLREGVRAWLPDGYSRILRSYVFGPSGFWTMAPLRYAAKFDPLDPPTPSTLSAIQGKEGTKFCHLATLLSVPAPFQRPLALLGD